MYAYIHWIKKLLLTTKAEGFFQIIAISKCEYEHQILQLS